LDACTHGQPSIPPGHERLERVPPDAHPFVVIVAINVVVTILKGRVEMK